MSEECFASEEHTRTELTRGSAKRKTLKLYMRKSFVSLQSQREVICGVKLAVPPKKEGDPLDLEDFVPSRSSPSLACRLRCD